MKFICNKCNTEIPRPPYKNASCPICGKGRSLSYVLCRCGKWFKVDRYSKQFCSRKCKHDAMRTGRKCTRITITKARSAQSLLAYHVSKGHIIRPDTCEECSKTGQRIEGAHYDYSEPLKVRWLCRSCHVKWDKANPKDATYRVTLPACQ
jgi:hypothetical protein